MENTNQLNQLLLERFKESFEGDENGDWYNGFFKTLDIIDAKTASIIIKTGRPSIYAHAEHIKATFLWLKSFLEGNPIQVDWPSTWLKNETDQSQWDKFKQDLKDLYHSICRLLENVQLSEKITSRTISLIAHTAYHAGSIRQLALLIVGF